MIHNIKSIFLGFFAEMSSMSSGFSIIPQCIINIIVYSNVLNYNSKF